MRGNKHQLLSELMTGPSHCCGPVILTVLLTCTKQQSFFFKLFSLGESQHFLLSLPFSQEDSGVHVINNVFHSQLFQNQKTTATKIHEHLIEFLHLTCLQTCCVNGANASDMTEEIAARVIFSSSQICLIAPPCVYCLQPYPVVANQEGSRSSCTRCATKLSHAGPRRCTISRSTCVFTSCGGRI